MKLLNLTLVVALVAAICAQASFAALGKVEKASINDALVVCADDARAPGSLKAGVQTAKFMAPGPDGGKNLEATQTGTLAQ